MIKLTNGLLIQECGSGSELFQHAINLLKDFLRINENELFRSNIFSFLSNKTSEFDVDYPSTIIYLRLLIERLIIHFFNQIKEKNLIETKEYMLKFLFTEEYFLSPELRTDQEINYQKFKKWDTIQNCIYELDTKLNKFQLQEIDRDIFGDLYQDLIHSYNRHEKGEYYTPKWLIDEIISNLWSKIKQLKDKNNSLKILDPSCGSGSFIIAFLNKALNENIFTSIDEIILSIYGFDVNELSLFMAKCNFLLLVLSFKDLKLKNKKNIPALSFIKIDTLTTSKNKNNLFNYVNEEKNKSIFTTFDVIVGNPPWITLKSIRNKEYQEKIKNEFFNYKLINKSQTHLFTQLEVASLFYNKAIDLYLKQSGHIAFVMPKSVILGTSHNEKFQKFINPKSQLITIWDLQNIQGLFGMPTCVLFAIKGSETVYPVDLKIFSSVTLTESAVTIRKSLIIKDSTYSPPHSKTIKSFYYDKFKVGASIFPRNLYFVKINQRQGEYLQLHTDPSINTIAKNQWKDISIEGLVHQKYLFTTLLAWELLPFGHIDTRHIILPISITEDKKIELIDSSQLDQASKKWFERINFFWNQNSTETSKKRFPNLNDRLNYNNLLIKQDLRDFIVLYSGTGTNICSCVIERKSLNLFNNRTIPFIPDVKTWIFETDVKEEAHYLSAVLNSPYLNELIKPLQPQGLGGGRAIHRRPLQFPIQEYDEKKADHKKLAELSLEAHELINSYSYQKLIKNRKQARELVNMHLQRINESVIKLLKQNTT